MLTSFFDEPFDGLAINMYLVNLPMVTSLQAAHGSTSYRQLTIISIKTTAGQGWGECSALTSTTYGTASAIQCFDQLRSALPHSFAAQTFSDALDALRDHVDPLAYAAVEMAVLDIALRDKNISLKQWLQADQKFVKAGAVLGLPADSESLRPQLEQAIAEGYKRIKIKISPKIDLQILKSIATFRSDIELHVDANGSYENRHSNQLVELFDAGFTAIEQPFAPADKQSAKALTSYANKLDCFVIADEAANSLSSIQAIAHEKTANAISVKSGRLGGLVVTQTVKEFCLSNGLAMAAGGMLESGLGRATLATLAACEGFILAGDVSPASRWLQKDPWQDLFFTNGNIEVPDGLGIAPPPDNQALEAATKQRWSLT